MEHLFLLSALGVVLTFMLTYGFAMKLKELVQPVQYFDDDGELIFEE